MKTTMIEKMQATLEKSKYKGFLALFIYTGIFIFLAVSVVAKFGSNLFHLNKAKLK